MTLYQNDQWNIADELGMGACGDGLAKMALEVSAPFTIAVNGKWGSGKTSVMRRAFATLGGNPIKQAVLLSNDGKSEIDTAEWQEHSVLHSPDTSQAALRDKRRQALNWSNETYTTAEQSLCVWYSPWQHQNADNPITPLLLEIQQQFLLRHRLAQKTGELSRRGGLAALSLLERVGDLVVNLNGGQNNVFTGTTEAVSKAWQAGADSNTQLSDGQRFHLAFEDAIETALLSLKQQNGDLAMRDRLIIFIDDLDRCEGSVIVALLEAIKLYLGSKRCVFVLGLDNTSILSALSHHWTNRSEDHNREYLEKLFQATVRVPAPQQIKSTALIQAQLQTHNLPTPETWAEIIVDLLEPNPRKLKNFANSFCAIWSMHSIPSDELQIKRLILFLYLNLYHPSVWRILERQPWSLRILRLILLGTPNEPVELPTHVDKESQRMMEQFFSQAFSHVLKHDKPDALEADDKHRGLTLEKSIEQFLDRIDRKGSDEYWIGLAKDVLSHNDTVDEHFLMITPAPEASAS